MSVIKFRARARMVSRIEKEIRPRRVPRASVYHLHANSQWAAPRPSLPISHSSCLLPENSARKHPLTSIAPVPLPGGRERLLILQDSTHGSYSEGPVQVAPSPKSQAKPVARLPGSRRPSIEGARLAPSQAKVSQQKPPCMVSVACSTAFADADSSLRRIPLGVTRMRSTGKP